MASDFLSEIVAYKKELVAQKKPFLETLKAKVAKDKFSRYHIFQKAISAPGQINLIAEIKKASPSKGVIRKDFDILKIGKAYADNGAAAISVLTEDKFFLGNPTYVKMISENFQVPVLTKDFILNDLQIYEAFVQGASAVLLIVAILEDDQMKRLMETAAGLDMDCLVEVHNEQELERALKCGAAIIGVNNRDLHTFNVDLDVSRRLIPQIPEGKAIVAESGIKSYEDVLVFRNLGAHAVLIGETFMQAEDIGAKVREVMDGK